MATMTVILMPAYCHREVEQERNNSLNSADDLSERQLLRNFSVRVTLRSSESERLSDNRADWKQHFHLSRRGATQRTDCRDQGSRI